jgi:hypothetical protein
MWKYVSELPVDSGWYNTRMADLDMEYSFGIQPRWYDAENKMWYQDSYLGFLSDFGERFADQWSDQ